MRNYLILLGLLLSLSACGPVSYLADLTLKQGERILRPKITCKVPRYTISFNINEIELKERFELVTKKTGCFFLASDTAGKDYTLTPVLSKTKQNQVLEVRLYKGKSIVDIHAYQYNQLNLQDKVDESVQNILTKINSEERHYAKNQ